MSEFKIPPISTLSGTTLRNFFRVIRGNKISKSSLFKLIITLLVIVIATPFHWWETWYFKRKIKHFKFKKPPLFILGHWRSGTTFLHNILCQDPNAAYLTTYHSVFPNNLTSKWLFKTFMRICMPNKRPSDNVELNINYPQEDEFAFANCQPNAYYNFFYFPKAYNTFFPKATNPYSLSQKEKKQWFTSYRKIVIKAIINTKGERAIIKNPVNTARIKAILELWPDAKFVYIYRNPVTVFNSTQLFFNQLFPTLWLHKIDKKSIDEMILNIYDKVLQQYNEQKTLIPPENLMELKFEDFEKDAIGTIETIYSSLLKEDFTHFKTHCEAYINTQKKYQKNSYTMQQETLDMVLKNWSGYMEELGYTVPKEITIK